MGGGWEYRAPSTICILDKYGERDTVFDTEISVDPDTKEEYYAGYGFAPQSAEEFVMWQTQAPGTGGFCGIWVQWFADLYLTYPHINLKNLFDQATRLVTSNPSAFCSYIIEYAKFYSENKRTIRNAEQLEKQLQKVT